MSNEYDDSQSHQTLLSPETHQDDALGASFNSPLTGTTKPSFIVGIGASAGGLQPLEEFFHAMPVDTGLAFVVVQHLSPDFKSLMQELLSKQTDMPVIKVEDGMVPERNCIYLITPRKNMTISGDRLELLDQDLNPKHGPNFPIDLFFRSLAKACGNRAIGVILSGTGSDGSRGVRAIDDAGGLVFVQSAESAQFDGMPIAAIVTGTVHDVMPPTSIATAIADISITSATLSKQAPDASAPPQKYHDIISLVAQERGVDFRLYKQSTIGRRLDRRRLIAGSQSNEEYFELLKSDPSELTALRNDLLVSVTSFFRDELAWSKLKESIFPSLIQQTNENETIRAWVTACATGEEAYTMAIVLREVLDSLGRHQQEVKIFATDVDEPALERAVQGRYPGSIVADIPPDLLSKYFTVDGEIYQISRQIREMIIFAPHNLIEDAPFTRTHIVSCRNALIYLQSEAQQQVLRVLHFSLQSKGVLFLGSSESVGDLANEFKVIDRKSSIHKKIRDVKLTDKSAFLTRTPARKIRQQSDVKDEADSVAQKETLVTSAFNTLAIANDALYIICDSNLSILHTVGNTKRFLRIPEGYMSNDITRLVPKSLSVPLSTAMHRAKRENSAVTYYAIPHSDDESFLIDVQAVYKPASDANVSTYVLILKSNTSNQETTLSFPNSSNDAVTQRLRDQEIELQQTRENLQSTIQELESTNEVHQTTNEQLTTANEELQSTNEELHSVNEELYTVNSEFQVKINELTELNNDIDNLLESTEIGVVFLDEQLNIRKFTPAATNSVRLQPGDLGRSFEDLTYNFDYPQLATDVRRVLSLGEAIEKEAAIENNEYILVRIHPYRAGNELTVGVVISFIDISELKHVEDALAQVEVRYRHLFQSDMFGIVVSNVRNREIIDANDTFLNLVGADRGVLPIKQQDLYPESEMEPVSSALQELVSSGSTPPTPTQLVHRDGHRVPIILSRTLISQKEGTYVSFIIDATELTQTQQEIKRKDVEMEALSENLQEFAYIASHELLEPLRILSGYSSLLTRSYRSELDKTGAEYIDFIRGSTTRMNRVVDDLLLFSRVHTQGNAFAILNVENAARTAFSSIQEQMDLPNVHFDTFGLPEIYADRAQITQLFYTLFDNAIKFSSADDRLEIEVHANREKDQWRFDVIDTGIGIALDDCEKIFSMFKRLHSREDYPGSGVGLAICKRIVERHNGTIWAEPRKVKGLRICFTLPDTKTSIARHKRSIAKQDRI